jgi:hypothetical protein
MPHTFCIQSNNMMLATCNSLPLPTSGSEGWDTFWLETVHHVSKT